MAREVISSKENGGSVKGVFFLIFACEVSSFVDF